MRERGEGEREGTEDAVRLYMKHDKHSTQIKKWKITQYTFQLSGWVMFRLHFLTIDIIGPEVDFNAESLVGIFDGGQGEVGQGFLGEVWHHSL